MAQFEIRDPESGMSITVEGDAAPSQAQAAAILSQHKAAHPPPPRRFAPPAAAPTPTGTTSGTNPPSWVPPPAQSPAAPSGFQPGSGRDWSQSPLVGDVVSGAKNVGRMVGEDAATLSRVATFPQRVGLELGKKLLIDPAVEAGAELSDAVKTGARWVGQKARDVYNSPFVQDYVLPPKPKDRVRVRAPDGTTGTVPQDQADKLPKGWRIIPEQ